MVPFDRLEEGKVGFSRQAHLLFKDRLAWSFDAQGSALPRWPRPRGFIHTPWGRCEGEGHGLILYLTFRRE